MFEHELCECDETLLKEATIVLSEPPTLVMAGLFLETLSKQVRKTPHIAPARSMPVSRLGKKGTSGGLGKLGADLQTISGVGSSKTSGVERIARTAAKLSNPLLKSPTNSIFTVF